MPQDAPPKGPDSLGPRSDAMPRFEEGAPQNQSPQDPKDWDHGPNKLDIMFVFQNL